MLKEYLRKNKISQADFAKRIGVSSSGMEKILREKSPNTRVFICCKIERETGLKPWDYLKGIDNLEHLYPQKNEDKS